MNPVAFWKGLPFEVREPVQSALVSIILTGQAVFLTLVGAAAAAGDVGSPGDLFRYLADHWWAGVLGVILPAAYRARQGSVRVANTVQLSGGASAVVTQPKGS